MKPKVLKGEVREFIDLPEGWYSTKVYKNCKLFYNEPFKPEMITEYFEGWEKYWEENNADNFTNNKNLISVYKDKSQVWFSNMHWHKPKTLNQFITNCIQAGVKLIWK